MYIIHSSPPKWQSYAEKIDDVSAAGIEEGMIHIGNKITTSRYLIIL